MHVAQHAIVVDLGVTRDGRKHILGLRQGNPPLLPPKINTLAGNSPWWLQDASARDDS